MNVSLKIKGLGEILIRGFAACIGKRETGTTHSVVKEHGGRDLGQEFRNICAQMGTRTVVCRKEERWQKRKRERWQESTSVEQKYF
jgi:hypothetical protein